MLKKLIGSKESLILKKIIFLSILALSSSASLNAVDWRTVSADGRSELVAKNKAKDKAREVCEYVQGSSSTLRIYKTLIGTVECESLSKGYKCYVDYDCKEDKD